MDSKAFYDELSSLYEVMFPYATQTARVDFLGRIFTEHGVKTVLDCGCGTGRQVIDLTLRGFSVTGSDLSQSMLEVARSNATANGVKAEWLESDFSSVAAKAGRTFGAVYCIGNSLPHVQDKLELKAALAGMAGALEAGGVLVLHLRNYEHIIANKLRLMPTLAGLHNGTRYIFQRIIDFLPDGKIDFSILTLCEAGANKFTPSLKTTQQYPATLSELKEILTELCLMHVTSYGGFDGRDYKGDGEELVIVAHKPPMVQDKSE